MEGSCTIYYFLTEEKGLHCGAG